jgi:hypothetical protein
MRKLLQSAIAAIAFAVFPAVSLAGEPNPELKAALIKKLDGVLPEWGAEVLRATDGVDWAGRLNLAGVARSFGPSKLAEQAAGAPSGTEGVNGPAGLVRVDRARGYVRMVNNLLVPRLGSEPIPQLTDEQTRELGLKTLGQLGIPEDEIGNLNVATQMAADGSVRSTKPDRVSAILKLFSAERSVNKLPVFGSKAIIAVTGGGKVQRLKTQWPQFRLDPSAALLLRAEVLDRAGDVMVDQDVPEASLLRAQIGYAPADDSVGSPYIPVALISTVDRSTPLLFSVPLAKPSVSDDR